MERNKVIQIRLSDHEKRGFELAAERAGLSVSGWARERLRLASLRDLEGAGINVPFLAPASMSERSQSS